MPVARPYVGKSGFPRRNQVGRIAGPNEDTLPERPHRLMHVPEKRLGKRNQSPRPQFDVRPKRGRDLQKLLPRDLPFPVAAMNRTGYFRDA